MFVPSIYTHVRKGFLVDYPYFTSDTGKSPGAKRFWRTNPAFLCVTIECCVAKITSLLPKIESKVYDYLRFDLYNEEYDKFTVSNTGRDEHPDDGAYNPAVEVYSSYRVHA